MKFQTKVDLPEWVTIPTAEMKDYLIGRVVEVWQNNAKVQWHDGTVGHIGIYSIVKHIFLEPTDAQWHAYYDLHNPG